MSQARKRVQKRNNDIPNFWYKRLIGMDSGRNADELPAVCPCMCSGFPAKMMEQTIVTSFYDVTTISHV